MTQAPLNALRAFDAVVRAGSFKAAAEMGKFANWKPYTPPVTAETAAQYAAGRRAA